MRGRGCGVGLVYSFIFFSDVYDDIFCLLSCWITPSPFYSYDNDTINHSIKLNIHLTNFYTHLESTPDPLFLPPYALPNLSAFQP